MSVTQLDLTVSYKKEQIHLSSWAHLPLHVSETQKPCTRSCLTGRGRESCFQGTKGRKGMYRLRVPQKPDLQSNLLKNGSLVSLVKGFISKLIQSRGQHSFSIMGHTESIIDFMGHAVSFTTIQLCCGL